MFHSFFRDKAVPVCKGNVLDIGSGSSPYKTYMKDCSVISMEYNFDSRPVVVGSALTLPFQTGAFDTVICTEVLEHLPDPSKCLAEISRVLKPGHNIYLTSPMTWYLHYEPHDYFRFTPHGIRKILESAGFTDIDIFRIGGLWAIILMTLSEKIHNLCQKLLFFLPKSYRPVTAGLIMFPINWLLFYMASFLDTLGKRWVFSVGAVARNGVL